MFYNLIQFYKPLFLFGVSHHYINNLFQAENPDTGQFQSFSYIVLILRINYISSFFGDCSRSNQMP